MKVLIVGAGLFGSVAADLCLRTGHEVLVFDDLRAGSGSLPAACLIKPSWIAGLGDKGTIGLDVLRSLYTVVPVRFALPVGWATVQWVDPRQVLWRYREEVVRERVVEVGDGWVRTDRARYDGVVLVAAGVWCRELVRMNVIGLMGAALVYRGECSPRIRPYAPYRQAVRFVRDPGKTWFGDGTAIVEHRWDENRRVTQMIDRARLFAGLGPERLVERIVGVRPCVPESPGGYFKRLGRCLWVSTGGAKNGTVLAGFYARQFLDEAGL